MAKRKRYKNKVKKLVDIIIPVYNRFDLLKKCLNAIPGAFENLEYQIIMVDNGSEVTEAKEFYGRFTVDSNVVVIRNSQNQGFPKACNRGVRRGSSPLVFFLNSDVIMNAGSGKLLVNAIDDPSVGVVGMKLLFPSPDETMKAGLDVNIRPAQRVQHVGLVTNIRGEVLHVFMGWPENNTKVNNVNEVMAVTGAALMTRRGTFLSLGGFDEVYGKGTFEDVDFCMNIHASGKKVIVETNAVGTHFVGATAEKYNQAFPLGRNYQIFLSKWREKLVHTDWQVL